MEQIFDTVIIGGGPCGYAAALYTARAGLSTAVVEGMTPGGQMTLTDIIDNYPGFDEGVDGFTLAMKMQQGAERFGAQTIYSPVLSAELGGEIKLLETYEGTLKAKTVIIATGASPRELGLPAEGEYLGRGVHYCAHCDGRFYKDKVVAVVGGGNSAASDALYLSHLAKKVILVHRRDSLRATKIYHEPMMQADNIEFCWNSEVVDLAADGKLNGIVVKNVNTGEATTHPCDGLFVSIGRVPATAFLGGQVETDAHGYIVAGEDTKTSVPGVFAAGDVRTKVLRQVVTAVADGAVAAHHAEEYLSQIGK